ncbi:proteasome subunit beta [Anaeramoeba ignava]|uniref:Proteasome subunit beta n=1 Tax=Anaeramoeba ignava TaxID=1746090 RepID=A0A9Q0L5X1_ANAIG|nr:proteasome subunit beta [Anaeramoeba ignava]
MINFDLLDNSEYLNDQLFSNNFLPNQFITEQENFENFKIPNIPTPYQFSKKIIDLSKQTELKEKPQEKNEEKSEEKGIVKAYKGTTTLAFVFAKGIVVAVDSRASSGQYIASQTVQKVIPINKYILGTMAGGAADCQFWQRHLGRLTNLYELTNRERMSVSSASKLLANMLYSYRNYGLSLGTMVSGYDNKGPHLYYVDNDGTRLKNNLFSVGSGSPFAYGVLDDGYKWDLEVEEACELGRRAIYHATHRDAYSGGMVNVYYINQDGWTKISTEDSNDLHWKYQNEKL